MQETLTIKAPTIDEYIKREAAIKALLNDSPGQVYYSREDAADCVRYMDAADVASVRHGHWEWFEEWSQSTLESPKECTDCGWRCGRCKIKLDDMVGWYGDDPYDKPKLNYCPNCGMKVDE